jgi:hypothetical protein
MESRVIDFTHGKTDISLMCNLVDPLRMILWAGDCVHDGITDIERLPNFDVYVCYGYPQMLQANVDYLNQRAEPGVICIIDVTSDEQMQDFISKFAGRITTIDADYHGNTPRLNPEYYHALLADGGKAYNVEGINSLVVVLGDYVNALEAFSPILPYKLFCERRYCPLMVELAKDNSLEVDFAWTSPDLKQPYYDNIRESQAAYTKYRQALNPNHLVFNKFNEKNLEEYWSDLAPDVLTFNYRRAIHHNPDLEQIIEPYMDRFKAFLVWRLERKVDSVEEFREQGLTIEDIQRLYKLSQYARDFKGFSVHFANYRDLRYTGGPTVYGMWLTRIDLTDNKENN